MQRYVAQHKRDAHRKQHLRQVVFSGSANEEAVDQITERYDSEPAAEHAKREASGVAGHRQSDIAADKIVGAVRHVHDAHQPKGDRETAGEQKQERGEGNAVDRLKDAAVHERWTLLWRPRSAPVIRRGGIIACTARALGTPPASRSKTATRSRRS